MGAVAEFQGQYYLPSDFEEFSSGCHRDVHVDRAYGGHPLVPSLEAELHIEYLKSMAPSVPLTVIYNDDYALLTWVNKINSINVAPFLRWGLWPMRPFRLRILEIQAFP